MLKTNRKTIFPLKLVVVTVTIFLLSSCGKEHPFDLNDSSEKDGNKTINTKKNEQKEKESVDVKSKDPSSSKKIIVDNLIGAELVEYPAYRPVNEEFTESLFNNRSVIKDSNKRAPVYRIEVDQKSLDAATDKLIKIFNLQKLAKSENSHLVASRGNSKLLVNHETGIIEYINTDLYQMATGVKTLDVKRLLTKAQELFDALIPPKKLKTTYLYRFDKYLNSSSINGEKQPDLYYEVGIVLNSTVKGIPVIGSGGKYGLHLSPDGQLTFLRFQYSNFIEDDLVVDIKSSTKGLDEIRTKAKSEDQISFERYDVFSANYGYHFYSTKSQMHWLIPSYAVFIGPKKGLIGSGYVYSIPATDDKVAIARFEEDINAEVIRKSQKKLNSEFDSTPTEKNPKIVTFVGNELPTTQN